MYKHGYQPNHINFGIASGHVCQLWWDHTLLRCLFTLGTMLGVYGAYVGPMLIHVRLLEAMLGPCSSHVELMLSQERHVPFKPLPGPKGTRRFWIMSEPCWAYMEPMLGLC